MASTEELEAQIEELRALVAAIAKGDELKTKASGIHIGSLRIYEEPAGAGDARLYQEERDGSKTDLTGAGTGGAPKDAKYLVGAAHADLSDEINVGATPGGELGGTWASPTVDATHSGSAHHTRLHAITGTSDHSATNWRVFYSDGSAHVVELALGADGTFLQSGGAATLPEFTALVATDIPDISATYQVVSEKNAASGYAGLDASTALTVAQIRGLRESGGQALAMGAVADGEYLKRSGTDIIGGAGGGGGATTALDNLDPTAINASLVPASDSAIDLGSSAPKYFANAYVDALRLSSAIFMLDAGAGKLQITSASTYFINGSGSAQVAIGGATPGADVILFVQPSSNVAGTSLRAIQGAPTLAYTSGASTGYLHGLDYVPTLSGGGGGAVMPEVTGVYTKPCVQAFTGTVTAVHGFYQDVPSVIFGTPSISAYYSFRGMAAASNKIVDAYGLAIADFTNNTGATYLLEIGAPYLRLLGRTSWTPAASETPLYLAYDEGPTLGQVTLGAADSGGAGFRVLRVPNAV